jgi:hypothetical protein
VNDEDSSQEQTGAEQAQSDEPQSEEEIRARLEEQLRKLRVEDLMIESVVSVLNLTARRIAKEDERDLEQGRVGIDAIRAWVDMLPEEAAKQIRQALSELQMLYAQAVGEGGEAEQTGGAQPAANRGAPGSGAEEAPRPSADPPPRLWTPPGST